MSANQNPQNLSAPIEIKNITEFIDGLSTFSKGDLRVILLDQQNRMIYIPLSQITSGGGGDIPTLQAVLTEGNVASTDIELINRRGLYIYFEPNNEGSALAVLNIATTNFEEEEGYGRLVLNSTVNGLEGGFVLQPNPAQNGDSFFYTPLGGNTPKTLATVEDNNLNNVLTAGNTTDKSATFNHTIIETSSTVVNKITDADEYLGFSSKFTGHGDDEGQVLSGQFNYDSIRFESNYGEVGVNYRNSYGDTQAELVTEESGTMTSTRLESGRVIFETGNIGVLDENYESLGMNVDGGEINRVLTFPIDESFAQKKLILDLNAYGDYLVNTEIKFKFPIEPDGEYTIATLENILSLGSLIPTYADNAAAITGGLAVNKLYKTPAGDPKIVV